MGSGVITSLGLSQVPPSMPFSCFYGQLALSYPPPSNPASPRREQAEYLAERAWGVRSLWPPPP